MTFKRHEEFGLIVGPSEQDNRAILLGFNGYQAESGGYGSYRHVSEMPEGKFGVFYSHSVTAHNNVGSIREGQIVSEFYISDNLAPVFYEGLLLARANHVHAVQHSTKRGSVDHLGDGSFVDSGMNTLLGVCVSSGEIAALYPEQEDLFAQAAEYIQDIRGLDWPVNYDL